MKKETYTYLFAQKIKGLMASALLAHGEEPTTDQLHDMISAGEETLTMRELSNFFHDLGMDVTFNLVQRYDEPLEDTDD